MKKNSQFREVLRRLMKNKGATIGLVIVVLEIFLAIFATKIAPYDCNAISIIEKLQPPSATHLLGTDELGRDLLSRLLVGARYSLAMGFISVFFASLFGIIIGSICGFYGGKIDNVVMRLLDIIQAMPAILLNIAISAALGSGVVNTIVALSLGTVAPMVRMLRGSVMSIRKMEYLESAELCNCSKFRIIVSHVLPNSISPLIVQATMGVASTILIASMLSFIGLGVQAPTPEWGAMLSGSRNYIRNHPHMVIFPGLAIAITVLALNMIGDGLRDAMDPKLKD